MEEKRDARIYEIGYLMLPTLGEEGAFAAVEAIKAKLAEFGAEHISEGAPELIELAYDMTTTIDNKRHIFETAFFGWVKFAINPEAVTELTAFLEAHEGMLRHLLVKTVREDTIAKKPIIRREVATPESHKAAPAATETPAEVPAEKVDEAELADAIDELVVEGEETTEATEAGDTPETAETPAEDATEETSEEATA